uniref:ATP synthase F0 subunit 6 n=1 Tax=Anchon yunnanense TaxID=2885775 RepID=UPI001EE09FE7|nr:ATP synthase F0 subunit 6 [Anchon yunnanense]UKB86900.1 ATP synthase F0 subunit 6 [Anchon yunnanense]
MMTNLFSTFDPCTGTLSMNWLSSMMIMFMFSYSFWINKNNLNWLMSNIMKKLMTELNSIKMNMKSTMIYISMAMFILINNTMGLLPYVFTSPSHLVFSLSMALPMWTSFFLYGWINKPEHMFKHLVPMGTPMILMPFMVIIETISNFIRPGSLAVRLTANMIAGHLLMSLLGNSCSIMMTFLIIKIYIMLMLFETAVSLIQTYVFTVLTTLYSSEI